MPTHCGNCGCEDPFRSRRILRLVVISLVVVVFPICAFYFLQRAQELQEAERRAAAIGTLDVEPTAVAPLPTYRRGN